MENVNPILFNDPTPITREWLNETCEKVETDSYRYEIDSNVLKLDDPLNDGSWSARFYHSNSKYNGVLRVATLGQLRMFLSLCGVKINDKKYMYTKTACCRSCLHVFVDGYKGLYYCSLRTSPHTLNGNLRVRVTNAACENYQKRAKEEKVRLSDHYKYLHNIK